MFELVVGSLLLVWFIVFTLALVIVPVWGILRVVDFLIFLKACEQSRRALLEGGIPERELDHLLGTPATMPEFATRKPQDARKTAEAYKIP
jgi:hypothetical protein